MSRNRELIAALITVVLVTALYIGLSAYWGVPPSSGPLGHMLGVIGFGLMLLTEVGYSSRKRSTGRARGTMRRGWASTSTPGSWGRTWCCCTRRGTSTAWPGC